MNETRAAFLAAATRILHDIPPPAARSAGAMSSMDDRTWRVLAEAGFAEALVPIEKDGAGLLFSDALPLAALTAAHAAAVPLPEVMLANGILAGHDLYHPGSTPVLAIARPGAAQPVLREGQVSGVLARVPWGRHASHYAVPVQADGQAALCLVARDARGVLLEHGMNMAGEPRDTITFRAAEMIDARKLRVSEDFLYQACAVTRCAQIAGAIARILELASEYANLRKQFGRPIGKFQAVQHMIARLAAEAVAAQSAVDGGIEALDHAMASSGCEHDVLIATAAAKIRCGEAAGLSAALAHQVFGAIGFTKEHTLEAYTKRLWAWRDEYGSEAAWSERLGECLARKGAGGLWPSLTEAAYRIGSTPSLEHV